MFTVQIGKESINGANTDKRKKKEKIDSENLQTVKLKPLKAACGGSCEPQNASIISAVVCFYRNLCCVLAQAGLRYIFSAAAVTHILL